MPERLLPTVDPRNPFREVEGDDKMSDPVIDPGSNIADNDSSDLFVESSTAKRKLEDGATPEPKKHMAFQVIGKRAYGGGPIQPYTPGTPYAYAKHEPLPDLGFDSNTHRRAAEKITAVVQIRLLPTLRLYMLEDKELQDVVAWLEGNGTVPAIDPVNVSMSGATGSGKSRTLNNIVEQASMAISCYAPVRVTRSVQVYAHRMQTQKFQVETTFMDIPAMMRLIKKCIRTMLAYVELMKDEQADDGEVDFVRDNANGAREVLKEFFNQELKQTDNIEDFLEQRSLIPTKGTEPPMQAVKDLMEEILQLAATKNINLRQQKQTITAQDVGEMHGKMRHFCEQGGFAPFVEKVRVNLSSPLLAQNIEIADLPGSRDCNQYLELMSKSQRDKSTLIVYVAEVSRSLSSVELDRDIVSLIREKGGNNVCLFLHSIEMLKGESDWTQDDKDKRDVLKQRLADVRTKAEEEAQKTAKDLVRQINDHKLKVYERLVQEHFDQQKFRDRRGSGKLKVVTGSNSEYDKHHEGKTDTTLSVKNTGIPAIRAWIVKAPLINLHRASFCHWSEVHQKVKLLLIWCDESRLPPRAAATGVFRKSAKLSLGQYSKQVDGSIRAVFNFVTENIRQEWKSIVDKEIDKWTERYYPQTHKTFLLHGGRHEAAKPRVKPLPKGATGIPKPKPEPEKASVTGNILRQVEGVMIEQEKTFIDTITTCHKAVTKEVQDVVQKTLHGLKELEQGNNLEIVSEYSKEEQAACIRKIRSYSDKFKRQIRATFVHALTDEIEPVNDGSPAFAKAMFPLYEKTYRKHPKKKPGGGNVTDERSKYLKRQILSEEGPFAMMAQQLQDTMDHFATAWSRNLADCTDNMFKSIENSLCKAFNGKKMSQKRRTEVVPDIKAALEETTRIIQANLDEYPADLF